MLYIYKGYGWINEEMLKNDLKQETNLEKPTHKPLKTRQMIQ